MAPLRVLDHFGNPLLSLAFLGFLWLQWRHPLRRQHFRVFGRFLRNLMLALPSAVVMRLAMLPIPIAVALWAERAHFGLLHWLALPGWVTALLGLALMDYVYWWWHFALHRVPLLWRFHNVHHTDLDLDVSTAARFHFGEMVLTIFLYLLTVPILGISPANFVGFIVLFELAVQFQHSNWRLPLRLERALNLCLVTPRMHGIHHSIVEGETNSNWGTVFVWWDGLHRTLRRDVPQAALTIGVPAYRDEKELTVSQLLVMPFGKQRGWVLPDGRVPDRPVHPARELAP